MSRFTISNIELDKTNFDLSKLTETKWINDGSIRDLKMDLVAGKFSGYEDKYKDEVESSWSNLNQRAEENFPADGPFKFYNSEVLNCEHLMKCEGGDCSIAVSGGVYYKDIASVRSNQELFNKIETSDKPNAFVVVNILLSADDKIVLGKRKFYGDWLYNTFECSGSFLNKKDVESGSLVLTAENKIRGDFLDGGDIKSKPMMIYSFPRIMETVLLCVSKTSQNADEMNSAFYSEVVSFDNSLEGYEEISKIDISLFHPPSRVAIENYFQNINERLQVFAE